MSLEYVFVYFRAKDNFSSSNKVQKLTKGYPTIEDYRLVYRFKALIV